MRSIPRPIRERILHLYEQGKSTSEIAEFFGFCVAVVRRVRQQFNARGTPGRTGDPHGSPLSDFDDGLMVAAVGVDV